MLLSDLHMPGPGDGLTVVSAMRHANPKAVTILERTGEATISSWFKYIQTDDKVMAVPMTYEQRTGHLPQVLRDLVYRLRSFKIIGSKELISAAAAEHGLNRRRQGYTASMLVEESRMLQVSVFQTLQNNLAGIDFSVLLIEVMAIADEIDSQLSQAMASFLQEPVTVAASA